MLLYTALNEEACCSMGKSPDYGKMLLIEARDFVYDLFESIDIELFDDLMKSSKGHVYSDMLFQSYVEEYNESHIVNEEFEGMRIIDEKLKLSEQENHLISDLICNFAALYDFLKLDCLALIELIDEDIRERITALDIDETSYITGYKTVIIRDIFLLLLENASVREGKMDDHNIGCCSSYAGETCYELCIENNLDKIRSVFEKIFKNFGLSWYYWLKEGMAVAYGDNYFDEVIPDYSFFYNNTDERSFI